MKRIGKIKRMTTFCLIFLLSINSFAAIVSDNDGSAFVTKAEFDALKSSFNKQIDDYNTSIDGKIDGAIASYLSGLKLSTFQVCDLPTSQTVFKTFDEVSLPWVDGTHDLLWFDAFLDAPTIASGRTGPTYIANNDQARWVSQAPDKKAKAAFISGDSSHPIYNGYASNWNFFAKQINYNTPNDTFLNVATGSNLNRYRKIRKINRGDPNTTGAGSMHNWNKGNNITAKSDSRCDFTAANVPAGGATTDVGAGDPYREGSFHLWPSPNVPWDMTSYDSSDKLVSITSVDTPVNCLSLTGKPNRLLYKFYDFYSTNATTRANARAALWTEMQKYTLHFRVHGWGNTFRPDGKHERISSTDFDFIVDDFSYFEPSGWTDANASSYYYNFYLPFITYDNVYLANTTKLWTAEYDTLMTDTNFKSLLGSNNIWENPSDGKTYYNLSAGLVLMNEKKNGIVTLEVNNTGTNKVMFYVMKEPMDVTSGYDVNKIIQTDKSNSAYNNGIPILAGATETITFNKSQQCILFNFQAVTSGNAKTKGGSVSIENINLTYTD